MSRLLPMRRFKALAAAMVLAVGGIFVNTAMPANADVDVYTTPGTHHVNGRDWRTTCSKYSSNVERCRTEIVATQVTYANGRFTQATGWVFNNLTYKPSPRSSWANNPLAKPGYHNIDGRRWYVECDTAWTGGNACRSRIEATVAASESGRFVNKKMWVFNNIVHFASTPAKPTLKNFDMTKMNRVAREGRSFNVAAATIGSTYYPEALSGTYGWDSRYEETGSATYALNGRCTTFEADLGERSDSRDTNNPTLYRVYIDGQQKGETIEVQPFKGPRKLTVDVTKGVQLKIWSHHAGGGGRPTWGGPTLKCWSDPSDG